MTMTDHSSVEEVPALDLAVLAVLARLVLAEAERDPTTGCVVHPLGRVKWLGGTWKVKQVLWESAYGRLPPGHMLVRTCRTDHCGAAEHHSALTRMQYGARLGSPAADWRQRRTA